MTDDDSAGPESGLVMAYSDGMADAPTRQLTLAISREGPPLGTQS